MLLHVAGAMQRVSVRSRGPMHDQSLFPACEFPACIRRAPWQARHPMSATVVVDVLPARMPLSGRYGRAHATFRRGCGLDEAYTVILFGKSTQERPGRRSNFRSIGRSQFRTTRKSPALGLKLIA